MSSTQAGPRMIGRSATRKILRRFVPFLLLLYFVNYLDRTNIGFAKLTMSSSLGLTETMFGLVSGLFFIGYLLFEVPSNLGMHRFGARRWISRIMVTWGIVASLMAFVRGPGDLYVLRILLGVAEAGFFPGVVLFLTWWLPRNERVKVISMFLVGIPLSSVIGAPMSTAIMQYGDGALGLDGWRLMFLVEGLPAILLGVIAWFYLTDRPEDAEWLTPEERAWVAQTVADEDAELTHTAVASPWAALRSPRILVLGLVYFGVVYGLYPLSFFLPTVVVGLAERFHRTWSLLESGLIVAIPFAIGAVSMVVWSLHSDATRERRWHVALPTLVAGVSIPVALYLQSPFAIMACISITCAGVLCALPVFWYVPPRLLTGAGAATGIALINSMGNASGFAAPYFTGWLSDATGSLKPGLWLVGLCMVASGLALLALTRPSALPPEGDESLSPVASRASASAT
ncbi:MAG: MFS transporter [Nocardioides sp.]